jgi:hypothetical protein
VSHISIDEQSELSVQPLQIDDLQNFRTGSFQWLLDKQPTQTLELVLQYGVDGYLLRHSESDSHPLQLKENSSQNGLEVEVQSFESRHSLHAIIEFMLTQALFPK